jgi:hypothetical protein
MTNKEEKQFFEKVYYKCNIEPLLEQIYQKTHLQEMARTSPYLFAHSIFISLQKKIINLKNAIADAMTRVSGNGTSLDGNKITLYKSEPKNIKKHQILNTMTLKMMFINFQLHHIKSIMIFLVQKFHCPGTIMTM